MTQKIVDFQNSDKPTAKRRLSDLPDRVVAGDPEHQSTQHYVNEDGTFRAGTWTSTPGKWHVFAGKDEFCYIVSGHVRMVAQNGEATDFRTGDAFVVPNGFDGYWEVVETTTKYFAAFGQNT